MKTAQEIKTALVSNLPMDICKFYKTSFIVTKEERENISNNIEVVVLGEIEGFTYGKLVDKTQGDIFAFDFDRSVNTFPLSELPATETAINEVKVEVEEKTIIEGLENKGFTYFAEGFDGVHYFKKGNKFFEYKGRRAFLKRIGEVTLKEISESDLNIFKKNEYKKAEV